MKSLITNIIFSFLLLTQSADFIANAQTSFVLTKEEGHYFTETAINGSPNIRIMVETGVPAVIIDEENFYKLCSSIQLEELATANDASLDSDERSLRIKKLFRGEVTIGNLRYKGLIYVVEAHNHIVVPFHRLINALDSTANLIRFNFKTNCIDFVKSQMVNLTDMHFFPIVQYEPMPIFESILELSDTDGHSADFKGKFVFDLGNASHLFMCRKSTLPILKKNKFKLLPSMDASGNKIGVGIFAGFCKIGSRKKNGISIGITKRSWDFENDIIGYVGPSFFNKSILVIDPEQKMIYYK